MRYGKFVFGSVVLAVIALLSSSVMAQVKIGGQRFQLVELNGKRFSNSRIYIGFDEGKMRLSGHSGCNRFFGGYELSGQDLKVDGIGSTKMACMRPGTMETEAEFLKELSEATKLRRNGINLNIFDGDTRTMRFRAVAKRPVDESGDMTAMKWILMSIGGQAVTLAKDQPFLNFDASKKSAGGNSGCNVFGGSYETDGATIKFSQMIATMRACEFEDRMTIERGYLESLQNANRFEISGKKLTIFKGSEVLLQFEGVAK